MPVAERVARPLVARFDPRATNDYASINLTELQAMLLDIDHATVITLTALTIPSYRKTGCPFRDNIEKLARVNGMLGWIYENAVNNQREREGLPRNFESLPRSWGTQLRKTCFISHITKKGEHKLYLKFKAQRVLNVIYMTLDGEDIPLEVVEPWLNPEERAYRQGVIHTIKERDYTVSNLLAISFNKMGYIIT